MKDQGGTSSLEETNFKKCTDYSSGIHKRHCYTMLEAKQNGLGKIIRHLKAYHSPPKAKFIDKYETMEEALFVESFVGEPHLICECLEKLQFLRFQTVCSMEFVFVTPEAERVN